jgi:hypothetical protein
MPGICMGRPHAARRGSGRRLFEQLVVGDPVRFLPGVGLHRARKPRQHTPLDAAPWMSWTAPDKSRLSPTITLTNMTVCPYREKWGRSRRHMATSGRRRGARAVAGPDRCRDWAWELHEVAELDGSVRRGRGGKNVPHHPRGTGASTAAEAAGIDLTNTPMAAPPVVHPEDPSCPGCNEPDCCAPPCSSTGPTEVLPKFSHSDATPLCRTRPVSRRSRSSPREDRS